MNGVIAGRNRAVVPLPIAGVCTCRRGPELSLVTCDVLTFARQLFPFDYSSASKCNKVVAHGAGGKILAL